MAKPNSQRILVITATAQKARRDKLSGIYDYAHAHRWVIQTIESAAAKPFLLETLKANDIAGIISDGFNPPAEIPASARLRMPLVYIDKPAQGQTQVECINNDDGACARLAAAKFIGLGLHHLAAIGTNPSVYWSRARIKAFIEHAAAAGCTACSYNPTKAQATDLSHLRQWLLNLPRPCGLFAVTDAVAKLCIDLLGQAGVDVPEEIAVIGIDNNELICENSTPSITSILPGFREAGRIAAEWLSRRIEGRDCGDLPTTYGPELMISRGSTRRSIIRREKIPETLEFIRTHACFGIRVSDVVAFAAMPKSTLELHFRLATARSIQQEIQRVRMEEVERLLVETRCPIGTIASRAGYHNDNYLKNLFKRTHRMTLSQFRASARRHQAAEER